MIASILGSLMIAVPVQAQIVNKQQTTVIEYKDKNEKQFLEIVGKAKGFITGPLMNRNQFLVFFDPQCPHCSELWSAYLPLLNRAKVVWIPVAFVNKNSLGQAAALMASSDQAKAMADHESLIRLGQGGIAPIDDAQWVELVKSNTKLLLSIGADRVPFITGKNPNTGKVMSFSGEMSTEAFAIMMGVTLK